MASRTQSLGQRFPRSRQLDFNKAMSDFKTMFPSFDSEVIEMVLRANNGLVDATVDQLLAMQSDHNEPQEKKHLDPELNVRLPSYEDTGAATYEPPPAYTPREEYESNFTYDPTFLEPHMSNFNASVTSQNTTSYANSAGWHPPLLGTLPNDFLRISLDDRLTPRETFEPTSVLHGTSEQNSRPTLPPRESGRTEFPRQRQDTSPSIVIASTPANDFADVSSPSVNPESHSPGKKGRSKKLGHMSRKFKRRKTKNSKGNSYQQISPANLIDDDSGEDEAVPR